MSTQQFGNEIRKARKEKKLTQTEFAEQCGFKQDEQSNYENGKRLPNIERLLLIAEKLGKQWKLM